MEILENVSLSDKTTFKLGGRAKYYAHIVDIAELKDALVFVREKNIPFYILGSGSNTVCVSEKYPGLIVHLELRGVEFVPEGNDVLVLVAAGENWDDLVQETVDRGLYGLENLSHIPGTVGAAPVQNIGAYGAEVSSVIESVDALNIQTREIETISNEQCSFGYRTSKFKREFKAGKQQYVIVAVTFKLKKNGQLVTNYKDVETYRIEHGIDEFDLNTLRTAIIAIRAGKFPDWNVVGTAGSFFMNPIISRNHLEKVRVTYPEIVSFDVSDDEAKVPAGWLIEHVCNLKGCRVGGVCVSPKHALVLLNDHNGTIEELIELKNMVTECIKAKTGIELIPEVNLI
jgi:UDP-N-acetylmuramate dehydrogenase